MIDANFKPLIRKSNSASLTSEGKIIIGVVPESSIEMEINEEWVGHLICELDGKKTVSEILYKLRDKGFFISLNDIIPILEQLSVSGILASSEEYSQSLQSSNLSQHEAIRYDRQILLFQAQMESYKEAFDAQKKISTTRVALIGLGGIGSYAFYGLAAMGFGFIRAVDFDVVELSNLSRQILYCDKDIGKLKTDVAQKKSRSINPNVEYSFINKQISTVEDAVSIISDVDIALVAADIPRGKIWKTISKASFQSKVPVLFLGSAQTWVCCGPLIIPGITPCYDCCAPETVSGDHPVVDFIRKNYTTTLIDPYNSIGASLGILETVKYITSFQECRVVGKRLLLDLGTYETFIVGGKAMEHCEICNCFAVKGN